MAKARDIVKSAMRKLGVIATSETLSNTELQDGLSALNKLIDSVSNGSLAIPTVASETFALVAGQQSYSFGTGADFDSARPVKILSAFIKGSDGVEVPMEKLTQDEWALINVKNTQSTYPSKFYVENTSPDVTVHVWPVPNQAKDIILNSEKPFAKFTSGIQDVLLPPGYERMLEFNLAIDLAPEYGATVTGEVAKSARESMAEVKRTNIRLLAMKSDAPLCSANADIYSGKVNG